MNPNYRKLIALLLSKQGHFAEINKFIEHVYEYFAANGIEKNITNGEWQSDKISLLDIQENIDRKNYLLDKLRGGIYDNWSDEKLLDALVPLQGLIDIWTEHFGGTESIVAELNQIIAELQGGDSTVSQSGISPTLISLAKSVLQGETFMPLHILAGRLNMKQDSQEFTDLLAALKANGIIDYDDSVITVMAA